MAYGGGEDIKKNYDFVDDFNELEIRITKRCICKVCDKQLENEKIIYIKSFRLHAQPFHICISCWKQINKLVEENELEEAVYGDSTKKKLEKWVKDNYKQYSTEWTYEKIGRAHV